MWESGSRGVASMGTPSTVPQNHSPIGQETLTRHGRNNYVTCASRATNVRDDTKTTKGWRKKKKKKKKKEEEKEKKKEKPAGSDDPCNGGKQQQERERDANLFTFLLA